METGRASNAPVHAPPPMQDPRPAKRPKLRPDAPTMPPRVALLRSLAVPHDDETSWNPNDKSSNLNLLRGGKTPEDRHWVRRNNVARSTDAIRGKVGYKSGIHLFEFVWEKHQRGTHAVVGVGTKHAPLHCDGYKALVGSNPESYGWELRSNRLLHNTKLEDDDDAPVGELWGDAAAGFNNESSSSERTEDVDNNAREGRLRPPPQPSRTYEVPFDEAPGTLELVLDFDEGTVAYIVEGEYLGVAFRNLKGRELFPVVSCVWGHCQVRLKYMGGLPALPLTLFDCSSKAIQDNVRRADDFGELPLPRHIIAHLSDTYCEKIVS